MAGKSKIIAADRWTTWRREIAEGGGTLAVVTGTFALWHPGNLAAVQEAARRASHVCVIIHPDTSNSTVAGRDAAEPGMEIRLDMASYWRAVSAVTPCPIADAEAELARLRPFTLVDCLSQPASNSIAAAARQVADSIVKLTPVAGCFTADIRKAIRNGQTPLSVPDAALPPLPARQDLDRFLAAGEAGRPLVTVNGCFDVLHLGHLRMLAQAGRLGARLLVLVNDDDSVRAYKGAGRPVFPIRFRLNALQALESVSLAYAFSGDNPLSLLAAIRPDIHVKGGSFEERRVRAERSLLESWGGRLEIIPLVEGFSTTGVVKQMARKKKTDIK